MCWSRDVNKAEQLRCLDELSIYVCLRESQRQQKAPAQLIVIVNLNFFARTPFNRATQRSIVIYALWHHCATKVPNEISFVARVASLVNHRAYQNPCNNRHTTTSFYDIPSPPLREDLKRHKTESEWDNEKKCYIKRTENPPRWIENAFSSFRFFIIGKAHFKCSEMIYILTTSCAIETTFRRIKIVAYCRWDDAESIRRF